MDSRLPPARFSFNWLRDERRRTIAVEFVAGVLALSIVLLAVLPIQSEVFDSHAAPVASYADAVDRITRRQEADDRVVAPGGRSVFMTHGMPTARVIVLFHGLTNSPKQFEHLAALLPPATMSMFRAFRTCRAAREREDPRAPYRTGIARMRRLCG